MTNPIGTCCFVLHTHLPWLAHAGDWPVGEEWLYQAWAASYLPVVDMLQRLAERGQRKIVTLGLTPVLAAQLDDAYCLRNFHTWLGFWQARAEQLAMSRDAHARATAEREFRNSQWALNTFESQWQSGASPVLRPLIDDDVVELLGGPATHPFLPLLDETFARFQLGVGLDDTHLRLGRRPKGIWAPECGYRPGLERIYEDHGVERFVVDEPTLANGTGKPDAFADAWTIAGSNVAVVARDIETSLKVWSPRHGYPGGAHYLDFHSRDDNSGFRLASVTSPAIPATDKQPYNADAAAAAVDRDATEFVDGVVRKLRRLSDQRDGRPATLVLPFDTELFGHWWHEGPAWLERVLTALPMAGVRVTTLADAIEIGGTAGEVTLPAGSWGSGHDYRVWDNDVVADLRTSAAGVQRRLWELVETHADPRSRGHTLDQLAREALLTTSSDWAFMVTRDSAADYARRRAGEHAARFHALAAGAQSADDLRRIDGPFPRLDARTLFCRTGSLGSAP